LRRNWIRIFADQPAERLYVVYACCHAAAFGTIIPLFAIYFRYAELSLFDIALLAFVFEGTILLFELPTGVGADLFGRLTALRIASASLALAGLFFIVGRSLAMFVAAEIICGIGEAFRSGSADAWISEVLEKEGRRDQLARTIARRVKYTFAATFLGMLAGGVIGAYLLPAGWVIFTLLSVIAFLISLVLRESRDSTQSSAGNGIKKFLNHTFSGIRVVFSSQHLVAILALVLAANFAYEGFDQYWQVFLQETRGITPLLFGVITGAAVLILFMIAEQVVSLLHRKLGLVTGVGILISIAACSLSLFALIPALSVIMACFLLFSVARGIVEPLLVTFVSESSPPEMRATVLSTQNLFSSSGEMMAALSAGLLASALGLSSLFLVGAIILVLGLFLLVHIFPKNHPSSKSPSISG
jgi:MFS family permease